MREITTHQINDANEELKLTAMDQPGQGGASHLYKIEGFNSLNNPSDPWTQKHGQPGEYSHLLFQQGPIKELGVNGITHEALLAILIDRLEGFQNGPYASHHNEAALAYLRRAMSALNARTTERTKRGVEGTSAV